MKRSLNNKEAKEHLSKLKEIYGLEYGKKDKIEIDDNLLIINNEVSFFFYEDKIVPCLKFLLKNNFMKKITVDMGAVKFVASGADIMRPGIRKVDTGISKDDFISVIDELHSKPLCVGKALFSGEEIEAMNSGKAIKNIHFIGDKIWNYN